MKRRSLFTGLAALIGGAVVAKTLPVEAAPVPPTTLTVDTVGVHTHSYTIPIGAVQSITGDGVVTTKIYDGVDWIVCDGRALPIEKHFDLYKVIGRTYGGDYHRDTFKVPNFSWADLTASAWPGA